MSALRYHLRQWLLAHCPAWLYDRLRRGWQWLRPLPEKAPPRHGKAAGRKAAAAKRRKAPPVPEELIAQNLMFLPGKDGSKLLVLFSAANSKAYSFHNNLHDYGRYDRLFVRDPYATRWYQDGIGESAPDPDALIAKILAYKRSPDTQVYAAGFSMGGYAALLFSCLGGFDKALTVVPQTRLRNGFFRNPAEGVAIRYPDLAPLIAANRKTRFTVLTGMQDYVDIFGVSLLPRQENVQVYAFPEYDHALPFVLSRKYDFRLLLRRFAEDAPLDFGIPAGLHHDAPWIGDLQAAMSLYQARRFDEAAASLEASLARHPDWIAGHVLLARIHYDREDMAAAERYWLKSLEFNDLLIESNRLLGEMYQRQGDVGRMKHHYEQFLKVRPVYQKINDALKEVEGML